MEREKDTRSAEEKAAVERRMTSPGIMAEGEDVIWDGEGEALGLPLKKKIKLPLDPDDDD
jgi:hypothetical protein